MESRTASIGGPRLQTGVDGKAHGVVAEKRWRQTRHGVIDTGGSAEGPLGSAPAQPGGSATSGAETQPMQRSKGMPRGPPGG